MSWFSPRFALITMLVFLSAVLVFHVLVLLQIIPYTIVWAGKLNSVNEMQVFESVSITINLLLLMVFLMKGEIIRQIIPVKALNFIIWLFVVLFAINTIGNVFSKTPFERYFFTPVTLLAAVFCWRIVTGTAEKSAKG